MSLWAETSTWLIRTNVSYTYYYYCEKMGKYAREPIVKSKCKCLIQLSTTIKHCLTNYSCQISSRRRSYLIQEHLWSRCSHSWMESSSGKKVPRRCPSSQTLYSFQKVLPDRSHRSGQRVQDFQGTMAREEHQSASESADQRWQKCCCQWTQPWWVLHYSHPSQQSTARSQTYFQSSRPYHSLPVISLPHWVVRHWESQEGC